VIVLVGFMGAGKTTVGHLLSERLGLPFADSDLVIEQRSGRSVRQIFAEDGEPAFREIERRVVADLIDGPEAVLALGGGAAEHPGTVVRLKSAEVIYLQVGYDEAMLRVAGDQGRPLLRRPGLETLYQRRLGAYDNVATLTVATGGRRPEAVSQDILARLGVRPAPSPADLFKAERNVVRAAGYPPRMRIGIFLNYAGGFAETVVELADYERAGADIVFVPEAYSFDAVSQLGFIAAKTERMQIASGILPLYSRTPALLAMTAAGLDYVSDGRFMLGLGASGPQVIEGWHGVPYDAPIGRSREIIEICRMVWRRDRLAYQGKYYHLPLEGGTGLGKPLKLINHPVRERIPVALAAIGPKNVTVAAELAESWMPIFYLPEKAGAVWGEAVAEGRAKRDPALGPLDVIAHAPLAIGDDVAGLRDLSRPQLALYIGGMGARGRNFYNDLARRFGYEAEAKAIQDAYLDGRKAEAEALVPAELAEQISLVGPEGYVAERLAAFRESGVTTLNVTPLAPTHEARVRLIEQVRALAD
jgi:F420-dependent oxidoreductase-like protein